MKSKRRKVTLFMALGFALVLVLISAQGQAKEEAGKQVLAISLLTADLTTADPHFATTTADRVLVDMIFNALLRYKPGNYPEIEPDLATSIPEPKMVNGKQEWVFNIRKGVMTHPFRGHPNGYELTSEDIVYSFERAADKARSAWAGEYPDWIHFEAVDKYTVKFILDKPLSGILFFPKVVNYSGGLIVPKKAAEVLGGQKFKTQPVGTGPFAVKRYLPKERIILERHSDYFRGKPILDEVHAVYMADVSAAEMALKRGELHAMLGPTEQPWVEKMESAKGIKVDVFGPGENVILCYNKTKPPLDSLDVRKAISYALARKDMVALFGERIAVPTYSPVPAGFMAGGISKEELSAAGIPWEIGPTDLDFQKAKELLTKAGHPAGMTLEVYSSERRYYLNPFQYVQAQLRKIGVDLKINVVDHSSYHSMIRKDANHLVFYNAWRPNPDVYLTRFFHSASIVVTGASPDTNFSHTNEIDDIIEQARFEEDLDKQVDLWKKAQMSLLKNVDSSVFCILRLTCARSESVDWGHPVKASLALYPQIDETTKIVKSGG